MKTLHLILGLIIASFLIFPFCTYGQYVGIVGYVVDSNSGKRLKDVSVYEKYSKTGTISDGSGYFKLLLNPGKLDLVFSDNNYKLVNKEFTLDSDTVILVSLNPRKNQKDSFLTKNNQMEVVPTSFKKILNKVDIDKQ